MQKKKYIIYTDRKTFHFKQPAGTSRGVYHTRHSWFVTICNADAQEIKGVGECAPLPGLSCDYLPEYESILQDVCRRFEMSGEIDYNFLRAYPSMLFGIETALAQLSASGSTALFDTPFARGEEGITINGLVWMGRFDEMYDRINEKLKQGFRCIKLKIGAIDFENELELIRHVRESFTKEQIELRVDANGGFEYEDVMRKLEQLAKYDIHSIEQPIKQQQWKKMADICRMTPLPIALDEELIGVNDACRKAELLDCIKPQYIIIKPSLHGGMYGSEEWIKLADERGTGSWITSALESNVGLNAIAHFTAKTYGSGISIPQGLGTGLLFTDNIEMPLEIRGDKLWYGA